MNLRKRGNTYLRLTGGLRRLKSSRGRLLQDGGGPRLLERFSPVDNSTRTRQPHMVLNKISQVGKCQKNKTKTKQSTTKRTTTETFAERFTFRPVLSRHQMHLWDLQTLQKQSLGDSWQPKHFLMDHSTQMLFLTRSCFHCFLDSQRKPCSQGDSLSEEQGLKKTQTQTWKDKMNIAYSS